VTLPEEFDLTVRSHRLHAQRFGDPSAPLVLALPGLSGNMKSFDYIGERIGGDTLQLVALDLRGRGRSEVTPAGTYGRDNHARAALAAADVLGFERCSLIGQSMGGAVSMKAAELDAGRLDAGRLDAVVLLDAAGRPDPGTLAVIGSSVSRLGAVHPSVEEYLDGVKAQGLIDPWTEYWDRYYRYELETVEGGVRSRTSPEAIAEDGAYGATQDLYGLWQHLTMPTLLVRATQEFQPGAGHIVGATDRDRFLGEVPNGSVAEIDANHMTVNTHLDTVDVIRTFFGTVPGGQAAPGASVP